MVRLTTESRSTKCGLRKKKERGERERKRERRGRGMGRGAFLQLLLPVGAKAEDGVA